MSPPDFEQELCLRLPIQGEDARIASKSLSLPQRAQALAHEAHGGVAEPVDAAVNGLQALFRRQPQQPVQVGVAGELLAGAEHALQLALGREVVAAYPCDERK